MGKKIINKLKSIILDEMKANLKNKHDPALIFKHQGLQGNDLWELFTSIQRKNNYLNRILLDKFLLIILFTNCQYYCEYILFVVFHSFLKFFRCLLF